MGEKKNVDVGNRSWGCNQQQRQRWRLNCQNALQAMSLISPAEDCVVFLWTVLGRLCWRLVLVLALMVLIHGRKLRNNVKHGPNLAQSTQKPPSPSLLHYLEGGGAIQILSIISTGFRLKRRSSVPSIFGHPCCLNDATL